MHQDSHLKFDIFEAQQGHFLQEVVNQINDCIYSNCNKYVILLFSRINVKYGQADVEQETYFLMGKREKVLGNVF